MTIASFDGRTARKNRGVDQMLYAGLLLVQRGWWRPTAKEISEQSGISVRTFFTHFGTVEDYYEALLMRHQTSLLACLPSHSLDLIRVVITGKTSL
jgi:AcrR family transcriptional regulator